jgi:hypothetical protein
MFFSSTKLEKRAEQDLPGNERDEGNGGEGQEAEGRNGQNNVYTYE